jgi:RND family efflux transporter MFP subunit
VWVSSDVQESHIGLVRKGEQVEIVMAAYPNEKFRGRVMQIADTEDPTTRTIKVRSELPNPNGRLRPEMYAQIRLVGESKQMPVVPAAAIVQADGKSVVYRELSRGVFQPVNITTGGKAGDKISVTSGISSGDRIVTDGVMLLRSY